MSGACCRSPVPVAEPLLRRAVASIPGLRGFVGVDFLWNPARCEAVVLEINPRPTTSFVGLSRLLPAGWLARAWLACCGAWEPPFERPIDLAEIVHARATDRVRRFGCRPGSRRELEMTGIGGQVGIPMASWLALDIGGANLKAAHASGAIRSVPFEVWRRPQDLARALADLVAGFPQFDRVAVTMTAELCDCFATKAEGVRAVLEAVEQGIPGGTSPCGGPMGGFTSRTRSAVSPAWRRPPTGWPWRSPRRG